MESTSSSTVLCMDILTLLQDTSAVIAELMIICSENQDYVVATEGVEITFSINTYHRPCRVDEKWDWLLF